MMETTEESEVLRSMRCELNFLSKPDGSCVVSQGETVMIASVYGPGEVKLQKLRNDKTCVETVYMPKSGQSHVSDRQKEAFISSVCDAAILTTLYPRTCVTVCIQEVQDFGGPLACAVNAVCLALINSGIEMKFLVAAVSCMVDETSNIIVDPDNKQLQDNKGRMTFVFENTSYKVVASHTEGALTQLQYQQGLLKCKLASQQIFSYYRKTIKRYKPDV